MYQAIDYMEIGYFNFPRFFFSFSFLKEGEGGISQSIGYDNFDTLKKSVKYSNTLLSL